MAFAMLNTLSSAVQYIAGTHLKLVTIYCTADFY